MFGKRQTSDVVPFDRYKEPPGMDAVEAPAAVTEPMVPLKADEIYRPDVIETTAAETLERAVDAFADLDIHSLSRRELAEKVVEHVNEDLVPGGLSPRENRDVTTQVVNRLLDERKSMPKSRTRKA